MGRGLHGKFISLQIGSVSVVTLLFGLPCSTQAGCKTVRASDPSGTNHVIRTTSDGGKLRVDHGPESVVQ